MLLFAHLCPSFSHFAHDHFLPGLRNEVVPPLVAAGLADALVKVLGRSQVEELVPDLREVI